MPLIPPEGAPNEPELTPATAFDWLCGKMARGETPIETKGDIIGFSCAMLIAIEYGYDVQVSHFPAWVSHFPAWVFHFKKEAQQ